MNNNSIPRCPCCGEELIETDEYDFDSCRDKIITKNTGYCNVCNKNFTYQTEYTLTKVFNIRDEECVITAFYLVRI